MRRWRGALVLAVLVAGWLAGYMSSHQLRLADAYVHRQTLRRDVMRERVGQLSMSCESRWAELNSTELANEATLLSLDIEVGAWGDHY